MTQNSRHCTARPCNPWITRIKRVMTKTLQILIKAYCFLISPLIGNNCRHYPTCSAYAHEALEQHGAFKGLALIFRRILRCHPWSKHPFTDPVPKRFTWGGILGYKRSSDK